ncbi:hypothetical protein lerEdw1_003005 [Lerista edwardsae]|nr:hypothetical protein lerEdw1_003005 [Lerista edwardsae]
MLRGCEGPETPPDVCVPCQMSSGSADHHEEAVGESPRLHNDQEMQRVSAREDSPPRPPSSSSQIPRTPPCTGDCRDVPCEEVCEGLCKGPARRPCEDFYEDLWPGKARLPSIVVEPIEGEDVESGELRWPPGRLLVARGDRREPALR